MLSVINICTNSIDDIDLAFEEVLTQLKDKKLLKNSVGIVACHYDYVEQGVVKALSDSVPFDIVGCSTFGSAVNGSGGLEHLTLTVLTSDDVVFSTVMSETISKENFERSTENAYAAARDSLGQDPAMVFMFGPVNVDVLGNQMLAKTNQLSGGIPIFGTLANDTSAGMQKSYVIKNGEFDRNKMVFLLIGGNFHPRFYVTAIAKRNIQQNNAIVTATDGYRITAINNIPVLEYFATLGVVPTTLAVNTMIPLLVDFGDGTEPAVYSMYDISEKGISCGVAIPPGTRITFAEVDILGIMETTEITLRQALEDVKKNGANGIIAIPCMTRSLVLSPNVEAEIAKSLEFIGDQIPFSLIYSGGEICPVYNQECKIINRFHNMTYTLVVF